MAFQHSTATQDSLKQALEVAVTRYIARNPRSKLLHEEAIKTLPGGNTRTVLHADPFPLCMKSGVGHQVLSEDGDRYTDLTAEFTAGLYGHSNPAILKALHHVLDNVGMNIGATTAQEQVFAKELCQRFNIERIRFTNSGTEANLHAIAASRLFTGRNKIVAFGAAYHGGVLGFKENDPAPNTVDKCSWIIARYNDLTSAVSAIQNDDVAAVIVEGMQEASGCIPGNPEFLLGIQNAAKEAGVIFILDEVMTSRISSKGIAGVLNLHPDIKTFGKYLGGGLAFGSFGGRADIMAVYDPRSENSIAHSGTFNNNTLVTHAGYAGITNVYTPSVADQFTQTGNDLLRRLNEVSLGTKLCFTGMGTVIASHFDLNGARTVSNIYDINEVKELKDLFWLELLEHGFWVSRRGFLALVLGTPESELDRFVASVEAFLEKYKPFLQL